MSRLLTAEDFVHLDIPAVVEQHTSTRLHPGRTQYSGACPYEDCDRDTNGFMVWPELTSRNCHYNCRGCRRAGDIVKLLRDIKGLSFQEVCDLLEIGQGKPAIVRRQPSPNEWQRKEREFLAGIYRYSQRGLQHARAQAYLAQRGIPLSVALEYGLCYIPPYKEMDAQTQDNLFHIRLWTDRLIFPLSDGGFTGRALTFWEPGMDEEQHKQILDDFQKRTEAYNKKAERKQQKPVITRWKTTATSGYFHGEVLKTCEHITIVEGPFDALALLAADIDDAIAAGRNGIRCDDIPVNVLSATLAYDGDASGQEAARRDEKTFRRKGIRTIRCTPSEDDQIKDWSARYRLQGKAGLLHLRTVLQEQGILLCSVCGRDATATDEIFFFDEHGCAFCPVHWSGEMGRQELPPSDAMISLCRDTQDQTILPVSLLETPMEGHEVTVTPQIIGGLPGEPEPVVEPSSFEGSYQTVEQVLALTHRFPDTEQLVLDLETTGLDPRTSKVITLAIGKPGNVAIIDLRGYYTSDPGQQEAWKDALQQLLHRDVLWIGHNLKFDWSFLAHQFGVKLQRVYDTMLVEKLLHAGDHVSASLQASAERYGITVTKEQRSWFIDLDRRAEEWVAPLPEEQRAYIRQDIEVPYQIWERQQEALAQRDLMRVVSLEHQALPAIAAMEVHGVRVDVERWRGILSARRAQRVALEAQIKQVLGEALARTQPAQATLFGESVLPSVHLTSSDQLREALHALGVNVSSASKEALQEVEQEHPVIAQLLEW
ncbi:MAG TPA: CHC2 zinc finger domain-containing protein, partial [Ktedonobacteraceae bacterium]|nr:CHC2 zinc finger domain-containing protein [Ktedonobacteraceae bacterium]